MQKPRR